MCNKADEPSRSLSTLHATFTIGSDQLRWDAYGYLMTQQARFLPQKVSLAQLIQMGLRSPDRRLKKAAVSLIWVTDQLSDEQKIVKLESIARNSIDAAAEYAFRLLYSLAGRPRAWDEADDARKKGKEEAEATLTELLASYDAEIETINTALKEFEELPSGNNSESYEAIENRRIERNKNVQALSIQKTEAQEAYKASLKEIDDAYKEKMAAKLSDEDREILGARFARRDALLSIAINAYSTDLTKLGVDIALEESCRRRPYAEGNAEEYPGYFAQLLSVLEEGLVCSYPETIHHTAMQMARHQLATAYPVLLQYLSSHDPQEQRDGIRGLVMLGQDALIPFQDEDGNAYPRTSVIFLDRLADDTYGNIERREYFSAIAQLRDRHPEVVEALFEFLDEGTENPDYTAALKALLAISN